MNVADITTPWWQIALGNPGAVVLDMADIEQCIGIVLTTPKGSDPLRPEFGTNLWKWLDAPMTIALPHLVSETLDALELWEPRIKVSSVTAYLGSISGQVIVAVSWALADGASIKVTEVPL